uniref:Protein SENSITIVITY TO RED LIGHT REDUCED 1 n=1 Tax=Elaeis guineensis var. tenera TaxID=51953 RepID=A0A6I9RBR1_ELAGV|nr:protein SENSITIVITY TO RED LIGHT REDUCED 1 [Elaeis guineensis]
MDAAPATKAPNPNPAGDWTVVSRRRRGKQRQRDLLPDPTRPQIKTLALTPTASSPWTPIDSVIEPARESKLLQRMQAAIRRLQSSRYYQRFLSRLRDAQIRNGLARVLGSGREFQMVVYGIGSIESYDPPRLQLALAVLLRRELGPTVASVDLFDPVLSATECAVVRALGCTVVPVDEQGRREATVPTLFYMPHCEAALYDALLEANWRPSMLNRMVVLGNSFAAYEKYMEEVAWSNGSVAMEAASKHILGVRRYVREVEMEEKGEVEASGEVKEEEEGGFFKAFHDTSWHFFELDDDFQMNSLKK